MKNEQCFQNIQNYLVEIEKIVGFPVHLAVAPKGEGFADAVTATMPAHVNFWIHPSGKSDLQYMIMGMSLGQSVHYFRMAQFPGCCALCISTNALTYSPYARKGINTIANKIRQEIAKISGYTTIICTDIQSNEAERRTLKTNGWGDLYQIKNRRTNNTVILSAKELDYTE